MNEKRKPDYRLGVMNKATGEKCRANIGGGWSNPDGTITIKLEPFVVIPGGADIVIKLFPNENSTPQVAQVTRSDEIPF